VLAVPRETGDIALLCCFVLCVDKIILWTNNFYPDCDFFNPHRKTTQTIWLSWHRPLLSPKTILIMYYWYINVNSQARLTKVIYKNPQLIVWLCSCTVIVYSLKWSWCQLQHILDNISKVPKCNLIYYLFHANPHKFYPWGTDRIYNPPANQTTLDERVFKNKCKCWTCFTWDSKQQ
jgi:hypothetical protein